MHAIRSSRERNIHTRVDQDASCVAGFVNFPDDVTSEFFQFSRRQVFFAYLDVVNATTCGFDAGLYEQFTLTEFVSGELRAIGNVVKKQGISLPVVSYQSSVRTDN